MEDPSLFTTLWTLMQEIDLLGGFLAALIFFAYLLIKPVRLNFWVVNILSVGFLILIYNLTSVIVAGVLVLGVFGLCKLLELLPGRIRLIHLIRLGLTTIGVCCCLGFLLVYKYTFLQEGVRLLDPSFQILVQIFGISYFVFKLIHVIVDSYRRDISSVRLGTLFSYICFFPAFLSGPIDRYQNFAGFRKKWGVIRPQDVEAGVERIIYGLFKKFVLADYIRGWISPVITDMHQFPPEYVAICALMYAFQLYFDFSGYSDLAIGTARIFGYVLPENFDHPYLKRNIQAFWRSWHMSLTSWLRDYLYFPLGGSQKGFSRTLLNNVILMVVCGLWHGNTSNFFIWGLYHGLALAGYRLYIRSIAGYFAKFPAPKVQAFLAESWVSKGISTGLTFLLVAIGWVFFFNSWENSLQIFQYILGRN